ncbi:MAG: hypothetical protein Q9216_001741 [Gyalolechia sp. 2 TL-2023]
MALALRRESPSSRKDGAIYRCNKKNSATRRMCNAVFNSSSRLALHQSERHLNEVSTTFVFCNPGSSRRRSVFTSTQEPESTRSSSFVTVGFQSQHPISPSSTPASLFHPRVPTFESASPPSRTQMIISGNPGAITGSGYATLPHDERTSTSEPADLSAGSLASDIRGARNLVLPISGAGQASAVHQTRPPNPRRALPSYECRTSTQNPGQPKALEWLTKAAKDKFDRTCRQLMAGWGVTTRYTGTCVLVPESWRHSKPLDLMALFSIDNMPSAGSPRAWYSYSDHGTTLVRAKVWFAEPRTGLDLDNFTGSGPYKPMDASHLCHHEHCVIHVVYEPADVNQGRKECQRLARFLRAERRPVPSECILHDPPCMMQRAALTSLEIYYHQFAVLSRAYGLPELVPVLRPRRYMYPTFESQLPCQYLSIGPDPAELVHEEAHTELSMSPKKHRPNLTCKFCVRGNIKTFASIIGLWSHIVNIHQDVDNSIRLEEIQQSALSWWTYWDLHSRGGKRENPTLTKLEEAQAPSFGWNIVMNWSLRFG